MATSLVSERSRIVFSKISLGILAVVAISSESAWVNNELIEESMTTAALVLVSVGCLGRVWSLAYIAGWVDDGDTARGKLLLNGSDVGETLISEGLSRQYAGGRRPWC